MHSVPCTLLKKTFAFKARVDYYVFQLYNRLMGPDLIPSDLINHLPFHANLVRSYT